MNLKYEPASEPLHISDSHRSGHVRYPGGFQGSGLRVLDSGFEDQSLIVRAFQSLIFSFLGSEFNIQSFPRFRVGHGIGGLTVEVQGTERRVDCQRSRHVRRPLLTPRGWG